MTPTRRHAVVHFTGPSHWPRMPTAGVGGVQLTGQWSFTAITTGVQAAATSNTRAWRPTELSKIICEDESTAASATTR